MVRAIERSGSEEYFNATTSGDFKVEVKLQFILNEPNEYSLNILLKYASRETPEKLKIQRYKHTKAK